MMVIGNTIMTSITITYGRDVANWLRFEIYNHVYHNLIKK